MTKVGIVFAKVEEKGKKKAFRKLSDYALLTQALHEMADLSIKDGHVAQIWNLIKTQAQKYDIPVAGLRVSPVRQGKKVVRVDILRLYKQEERLFISVSGNAPSKIKVKVTPPRAPRAQSQSSFSDFRALFVRGGGTASEAGTVWKRLREQSGVQSSDLSVEDAGSGKIVVRKPGRGSSRILVANIKVSK